MKRAFVLGWVVCLSAIVACSASRRDASAGEVNPDGGGAPAAAAVPRPWVQSIGAADHAQLAALPDGGVLLVSVVRSLSTPGYQVQIRALGPGGDERWAQVIGGGDFNLPWEAPAVAVDRNGDIYLTLGSYQPPSVMIGDRALECATACGAVASFGPDGDLRWLAAIPRFQGHFMTAVENGVVLAMAFSESSQPVLMAISSDGERLWEREWSSDYYPGIGVDAFVAADGSGGFYLVGRARDGGSPGARCGTLARHAAVDGSVTWETDACDDDFEVVGLSDVVGLEDGTAVALAHNATENQLMGFGPNGEHRFALPLPVAMRPRAAMGNAALLVAPQIGPLAAVLATGEPDWQWPGALANGALTDYPSGLCHGSAIPAPGDGLYVLSLGCQPARALLGAPPISEVWSGVLEEFPYQDWILARIDVPAATEYAPRCGNGWLDPGEECDAEHYEIPGVPADGLPRETMCSAWHPSSAGWQGSPACTDECRVDFSPCETTCGNGRLDEGEGCDAGMFRDVQSCDDAGLGSGPLACVDCYYDLSVCPMRASCGNGVLESWEKCDGALSRPEDGPPTCGEAGFGPSDRLIGCMPDCLERDYSTCEQ